MCIESVNSNQAWTNTQAPWSSQNAGQVRNHHGENHHEGHGHGHAEHAGHSRHNGLMRGIMDTLNQLWGGAQTNSTDSPATPVDAVSVTIEVTTINISSTTITGAADTASAGANSAAATPADATAPTSTAATDAASTATAAPATDADGDDDGCESSGSISPRQALHAFMHSLVQALNQAVNQTAAAGANQGGSTNATAAQAYGGDTTTGLRSLAQSLDSGDPSPVNNPGLDALKTDFQNLLDALGMNNGADSSAGPASGAQDQLLSFLNALVANLGGNQDTSNGLAIGGIVNAAM